MSLAYGCKFPTRKIELKFGDVLKNLPPPPKTFGHYKLVTQPWGMLQNNIIGDCVVAGAAHETMVLNAMGGRTVIFSDPWVVKDYHAAQGNPPWPFNDNGLDMEAFAARRRTIGIHDWQGIRHRVDAYAELTPNDPTQLLQAIALLGVAGIGLNLPAHAGDMFQEHVAWTDTSAPSSGEGHYVAGVGRNSAGNIVVVTWGGLQAMSPAFFAKYGICSLAYLSREQLNNAGLTPDQYDKAKLDGFINALGAPVHA